MAREKSTIKDGAAAAYFDGAAKTGKPKAAPGVPAAAYFGGDATKRAKPKVARRRPAEAGCREGFTRRTFVCRKDLIEKMQAAAYWHMDGAETIANVLETALEAYFRGRKVKPKPSK